MEISLWECKNWHLAQSYKYVWLLLNACYEDAVVLCIKAISLNLNSDQAYKINHVVTSTFYYIVTCIQSVCTKKTKTSYTTNAEFNGESSKVDRNYIIILELKIFVKN